MTRRYQGEASSSFPTGNCRGVTLVELIVYMVVSIFVITFSLELITSLLTNMEQERRVVDIQHDGSDIINMLLRDVGSMGFKYYLGTSNGTDFVRYRIPGTWTGADVYETAPDPLPADSAASFFVEKAVGGDVLDSLTFFRGLMETSLEPADQPAERVSYFVNGGKLKRVLTSFVDGSYDAAQGDTVVIHDNTVGLVFTFSPDYERWYADPSGQRDEIRYMRISLLIRSTREGSVQTNRDFILARAADLEDLDTDMVYSVESDRHLYRKYEATVEVPSNGIL
ncbi:hypothetical protein [Chitinivibrio alkaliphilus]|uniref:Prepilin-type N-terminal cleavage/methylation domain-containing protein n=1 Tax=Chitinivibrio alkaliphilus ACht1 TaxID=1313304 RepID=U7DDV3_9BACT|nr:hypothetical protein [Chitinivibrio alkaliphilus]ERP39081.1 hypothetical protein CALK_0246 [Chitinivibrio alkaliphilus ACht1]